MGERHGIGVPFVLVGVAILGTVPLMHRLLPDTGHPNGHSYPNDHSSPNGHSYPNDHSYPNGHSCPDGHSYPRGTSYASGTGATLMRIRPLCEEALRSLRTLCEDQNQRALLALQAGLVIVVVVVVVVVT